MNRELSAVQQLSFDWAFSKPEAFPLLPIWFKPLSPAPPAPHRGFRNTMEFINNLLGEVGEALSYDTCCLN